MAKLKTYERTGHVTYDEFCARIEDGQKADLIDGVIYMASPDNTDASDLFMWLATLLYDYVQYHDLGAVHGSRVACRLDDTNAPEPDILFVDRSRLDVIERGGVAGPADLAVEIVSPESVERDYEKKRRLYERFGFREYWIVDEELERVTLYRLKGGAFKEARPRKGVLTSSVLPGFWLRPAWVWQQPRPKKAAVLEEILAGPPA